MACSSRATLSGALGRRCRASDGGCCVRGEGGWVLRCGGGAGSAARSRGCLKYNDVLPRQARGTTGGAIGRRGWRRVTAHGLRVVLADGGLAKGVGGEPSVGVVLAENHPSLRRSLRSVLDTEDSVLVLAEASDLATATRHVGRLRPQVFLFDPWLLDQSGVGAVRCLREQAPSTEITVLTMRQSQTLARRALAAGALGFVQDTADLELPETVRLAARGEGYTSPRVSPHLPGAQALGRRGAAPLITREILP